jgi:hypothetical protein
MTGTLRSLFLALLGAAVVAGCGGPGASTTTAPATDRGGASREKTRTRIALPARRGGQVPGGPPSPGRMAGPRGRGRMAGAGADAACDCPIVCPIVPWALRPT